MLSFPKKDYENEELLWTLGSREILTLSDLCGPEGTGTKFFSNDGDLQILIKLEQFEKSANSTVMLKNASGHLGEIEAAAESNVVKKLGTLLHSGAVSDLRIETADSKVVHAHKAILAGSYEKRCIHNSLTIKALMANN
jgi:hypothetical protein